MKINRSLDIAPISPTIRMLLSHIDRSELMNEQELSHTSKGDDERAAMHACVWSWGRRASDEAVMTRTRHFSEDEG